MLDNHATGNCGQLLIQYQVIAFVVYFLVD